MMTTSKELGMNVEDFYAGLVGDNVSCNRIAFRILRLKYKKMFFVVYIAHYFDLLMEDVCKFAEVDTLIRKARSIATFVRLHKYLLAEV